MRMNWGITLLALLEFALFFCVIAIPNGIPAFFEISGAILLSIVSLVEIFAGGIFLFFVTYGYGPLGRNLFNLRLSEGQLKRFRASKTFFYFVKFVISPFMILQGLFNYIELDFFIKSFPFLAFNNILGLVIGGLSSLIVVLVRTQR